MKHIDRMIAAELAGPWLFGVALFTTLIVASSFLLKASDYIVNGIPPATVGELMLLFLPSVMVKTFPMAMLLAGLLGFGRLSGDSEITALKAAGVSIGRMMVPVAGLSICVAAVALLVNETVVPAASVKRLEIQDSVARTLDVKAAQPRSTPIMRNGKLAAMLVAADFNMQTKTLRGATVITYGLDGSPKSYLFVKELQYTGKGQTFDNWRIIGGAQLTSADGSYTMDIYDQAWPDSVPKLDVKPEDLITASTSDQFDSFSMGQMKDYIEKQRQNKNVPPATINNLEFAYWNKLALPLAAIIYGLLGAPLGIRNQRSGTASGFALAVAIIFAYVTLSNFMNVYAQGGVIPPYLASFTPLAIGLACSGVIMWRRNK